MSVRTFEIIVFIVAFAFAVVVILIVLALFFKNSKLKIKDWFQIETEAKDCKKFENTHKELEDHFVANAIENDNRLEYLQNKSIDDIKENYKDITNIKNQITELNIYKEYSIIIFNTSLKVLFKLFEFLEENHILEKTSTEINLLANSRTKDIIALYNEAFKKSVYSSIQSLTIEKLSGAFYYIIKNILENTYLSIYKNYNEKLKDRKDNINSFIDNNKQLECSFKIKGIQPIMTNSFKSISDTNNLILSNMLTDIINILLGLFYDKLKE